MLSATLFTIPILPGEARATSCRLVRTLVAERAIFSGPPRSREFLRIGRRVKARLRQPPMPAEIIGPTREKVEQGLHQLTEQAASAPDSAALSTA